MDLLWSDPTTNDAVEGVQPSPRGPGLVTFGPDRVKQFCKDNDLQLIVRAHECVMDGFERFAQGHLITLFSATNYCGTANNAGEFGGVGCWSTALQPPHALQTHTLPAVGGVATARPTLKKWGFAQFTHAPLSPHTLRRHPRPRARPGHGAQTHPPAAPHPLLPQDGRGRGCSGHVDGVHQRGAPSHAPARPRDGRHAVARVFRVRERQERVC